MEEEVKLFGDVNNFASLHGLNNKNDLDHQISSVIKSTLAALQDAKKALTERKNEGDSLMKTYLSTLVDYEYKRDQREKIVNATLRIFSNTKETNATKICGLINTAVKEKLLDCSLVRQFQTQQQSEPKQHVSPKALAKTTTISSIIKPQKGGAKKLSIDMTNWKKGQQFKVAVKTSTHHIGSVFSVLDSTSKPLWKYEIPQEGIITSPTLTYSEGGYITYSVNLSPGSEDLQVVLTVE